MKVLVAALAVSFVMLWSGMAHAEKVFAVKYASRADIKVFAVKYASRAKCHVFKVKYASRANNNGKWFGHARENQGECAV